MPNSKKMTSVVSKLNHVWLIEDNDTFRNALVRVINGRPGMNCTGDFSSCEDALATLDKENAPEIVLLDVGLPGMSGIDGIRRLREQAPNIRIIMLTMFDDHDKVFKSICAGASGYLLKTAPKDKITEAIKEVIEGGAPMDAPIARKVLDMFTNMAAPKADYGLTSREKEVLEFMVQGLCKKEIADNLTLSYHTIDTHLRNIYQKLHVNTRASAVVKAVRERLF